MVVSPRLERPSVRDQTRSRNEGEPTPAMYTDAAYAGLVKEQPPLENLRRAAGRLHAGAKGAAERELSSADQHPAELTTETIELELD